MAEKENIEPCPPSDSKTNEGVDHESAPSVEDSPVVREYPSSLRLGFIMLSICITSFLVGLVSTPLRVSRNQQSASSLIFLGPNHRGDRGATNNRRIPRSGRHSVVDICVSVRTRKDPYSGFTSLKS